MKTSPRETANWSVKQRPSPAFGTKSFKPRAVPGLKSWAIFTTSLRDDSSLDISPGLGGALRAGTAPDVVFKKTSGDSTVADEGVKKLSDAFLRLRRPQCGESLTHRRPAGLLILPAAPPPSSRQNL